VGALKFSVCVPVFWIERVRSLVCPVTTPPNGSEMGVTLSCAALTTPTPVTESDPPPPPVITTLIAPDTEPAAVGLNVTGSVNVCPDVMVFGNVRPAVLNVKTPFVDVKLDAALIVRFWLAVNVAFCVDPAPPTVTLPKLSAGAVSADVPAP